MAIMRWESMKKKAFEYKRLLGFEVSEEDGKDALYSEFEEEAEKEEEGDEEGSEDAPEAHTSDQQ